MSPNSGSQGGEGGWGPKTLHRLSLISLHLASPTPTFHCASVPNFGVTILQFLQKAGSLQHLLGMQVGVVRVTLLCGEGLGYYSFEDRLSIEPCD